MIMRCMRYGNNKQYNNCNNKNTILIIYLFCCSIDTQISNIKKNNNVQKIAIVVLPYAIQIFII
jgi:hypothetical protein